MRIDEPVNIGAFNSYKRLNNAEPKNNSTVYLGTYDMKYYLDR